MRPLAIIFGVLLVLQTYFPIQAFGEISVSGNSVEGSIPCNKIGSLLLADGLAALHSTTIEVKGKTSKDSSSQSQLNGVVYKVEKIGGDIHGSCYFAGGPGLPTLDASGCPERIDLLDGSSVSGPISSLTADTLTASGQSIAMSAVKAIHSSRAFNFTAKASGASKINFEPTCLKVSAAKEQKPSKSTGNHWVTRHPYATIGIGAAVATGVACGVAIPVATAHHGHPNRNVSVSSPSRSSSSQSIDIVTSNSSSI